MPIFFLLPILLLLLFAWRRGGHPPTAGSVFHQIFHFAQVHDYHTRLSSKHKTFQIFGHFHREIYTVDPVTVEHILKTNFANYGKGKHNYEKMEDFLGDGIFAVDGDKWRHQRKLASFDFSTRVLRDSSSIVFKANAAKLARIIHGMPSLQPFDLQDLLLRSTMDSIFRVAFGVELGCLAGTNQAGVAFARAFDDSNATVSLRYVDPLWKLKRFLNVGMERIHRKNVRLIDDFVRSIISDKIANMSRNQTVTRFDHDPKSQLCIKLVFFPISDDHNRSGKDDGKSDMLSRFLEESIKDQENMTQRYLRDIILNFLIAGKDTTAGTLAWFFYLMCKHPSIQDKVASDVNRAIEANTPIDFDGCTSRLTDQALDGMHYLHAALTETLRLYPAVPMDPKQCFGDDTLPDGSRVGEGDVVAYLAYSMGRMRFLWGEDAEVFRPERWLDEEGRFQPESPYKFTAFQAGPRICLGKEFAYRQMKIFAAVLLHFFSFRLDDEAKIVRYRTMLTLHVDGGLHVRASSR